MFDINNPHASGTLNVQTFTQLNVYRALAKPDSSFLALFWNKLIPHLSDSLLDKTDGLVCLYSDSSPYPCPISMSVILANMVQI